jgi:hypothetical protein
MAHFGVAHLSSGICGGTPGSVLVFEEEMSSLAGVPSRKCLAMNIPSMPGVYDLAYSVAGRHSDARPAPRTCCGSNGQGAGLEPPPSAKRLEAEDLPEGDLKHDIRAVRTLPVLVAAVESVFVAVTKALPKIAS